MSLRERIELERRVQDLERVHSDWPARRVETEIERLIPVAYGNWKDDTPNPKARLRQIQRWRRGYRNPPARKPEATPFHHLWPVGEKQRQGLDPFFAARPTLVSASHRIFLHNCTSEPVREVRFHLGGKEVGFEPSIAPGRFAELHWARNETILNAAIDSVGDEKVSHHLVVDFAIARGTKRARLEGELSLDSSDGWIAFTAVDGTEKEIE